MMLRLSVLVTVLLALLAAGCGSDSKPPTQPPPVVNPPTNTDPPANTTPVIDSIAAQGRRTKQPARFADVGETIDVTATVRDPETPIEELTYQWSATAGTFTGTGRVVTWTAPATISEPNGTTVTITLKVIETFGYPGQPKNFSHDTTSTVSVDLHDSVKEVGAMSVRFLTEFSKPKVNTDWRDVMKDFKRTVCPIPAEYDEERESVENHIQNFTMHSYEISPATVSVTFGGTCLFNLPGDACAAVRVMWDSTGPEGRRTTTGVDYLSAVYSADDRRYWLCSSRFEPFTTFGHPFYAGR